MSWKGGELMTKGLREMNMKGGIERFLVVDEEDFKLFHGDAFRILPYLNKRFAMILVDPPFFTWVTDSKGDKKPDHNMLSDYVRRKLDYGGCIYLCGTQPQLAMDWHWWARFFTFLYEKIQAKNTGPPAINRRQPRRIHENIWCMYRTLDSFKDLKITYDRITKKGTTKVVTGKPMRIWGPGKKAWRVDIGTPVSVFYGKKIDRNSPEYVGHPTQKPEKLIAEFIEMSTEEGDWILDPFSGSGTVSAVARKLGRNSVAIEIEDKWIDMIVKRVKQSGTIRTMTEFFGKEVNEGEYKEYLKEKEEAKPTITRQKKLGGFVQRDEP